MEKIFNNSSPLFRTILLGLPFAVLALGLYFYSRPYTYVVRGETAIVCNNERVYPASPNNIRGIDAIYSLSNNESVESYMKNEDIKARNLCAYGVTRDFIPFRNTPTERNYTVRLGTSAPATAQGDSSNVTLSRD